MNPSQSLERAVCAWLKTEEINGIDSGSIYKGVENSIAIDDEESNTQPQTRIHPSVTVSADGPHDELYQDSKVFRGNLMVTVEVDANNTTDTDFNVLCETVFSRFDITTLASSISSANDDFTVIHARIFQSSDVIRNGRNWQGIIRLEFVYAQADL